MHKKSTFGPLSSRLQIAFNPSVFPAVYLIAVPESITLLTKAHVKAFVENAD